MAPTPPSDPDAPYVEIWNDVVDLRHLRAAVVIGIAFGLPTLLAAQWALDRWLPGDTLSDSYALLAALLACLGAGVICARLFPPKRELSEERLDTGERDRVIDELAAHPAGLGRVDELPESVRAELRQVELYDAFKARESGPATGEAGEPGR